MAKLARNMLIKFGEKVKIQNEQKFDTFGKDTKTKMHWIGSNTPTVVIIVIKNDQEIQ